jgi:hypothetical protein
MRNGAITENDVLRFIVLIGAVLVGVVLILTK